MRRFQNFNRKLNITPPKWVQAAAVVAAGTSAPIYLIWGSSSRKQTWTIGAFVALGVYLLIVAGFALLAVGVTGGNVTTREQDKEIGERWGGRYQRYWWIPFTACLLSSAYGLFKFYA